MSTLYIWTDEKKKLIQKVLKNDCYKLMNRTLILEKKKLKFNNLLFRKILKKKKTYQWIGLNITTTLKKLNFFKWRKHAFILIWTEIKFCSIKSYICGPVWIVAEMKIRLWSVD
jgi:hypothetical protein